ncbi:MAG TPA: methyltransferase domain-containing protein [Gaiellaceae bacterium]|jgi:SAM-dependent methyltransferase
MDATARYDGFADWYDAWAYGGPSPWTERVRACVRELLGEGSGRLLDLGCGGGAQIPLLQELGWTVTGIDVSADQLRVARGRVEVELVQADAMQLPFEDERFDAVASLMIHSDVDDYAAVLGEAARVLRRDGALLHVGLHPCFFGHFSEPVEEGRLLRPGYHETALSFHGWDPAGARAKVGARHVPLAGLLNGLLDAGLSLERVLESEGEPPSLLAFRARRGS